VFDEFTINAVETVSPIGEINQVDCSLIRKSGIIDGEHVTVLLDCGASTNLIRPGIVQKVKSVSDMQLVSYDGSTRKLKDVKTVEADVNLGGMWFPGQEFTESELSSAQDVILGKPWFAQFEPQVNWRTNEVSFPNQAVHQAEVKPEAQPERQAIQTRHRAHLALAEAWRTGVFGSVKKFRRKFKDSRFAELFFVKVVASVEDASIPDFVRPLVEAYSDCFPDKLPDGLPPERVV
jgi:hypothetical protein